MNRRTIFFNILSMDKHSIYFTTLYMEIDASSISLSYLWKDAPYSSVFIYGKTLNLRPYLSKYRRCFIGRIRDYSNSIVFRHTKLLPTSFFTQLTFSQIWENYQVKVFRGKSIKKTKLMKEMVILEEISVIKLKVICKR